jgi:hypothetical protein
MEIYNIGFLYGGRNFLERKLFSPHPFFKELNKGNLLNVKFDFWFLSQGENFLKRKLFPLHPFSKN